MTADEAAARAKMLYLADAHPYGCAETAFIVLKEAFGLPDPLDSSAAMVLNGGFAYSGGVCGAISGASLAVGLLAERLIPDHALAKRTARAVMTHLMDDFRAEYGAVDCRMLLGRDISTPEQHQAFLDSGIWRETCMSQVELVVRKLASLPQEMALHETP